MRHRIWREVGTDGATVSQLTNRLGTNKGNVAHHVKVLVAAGLLAPSRTRTVRGGTEQYYVTAVPRLRLPDGTDATRRDVRDDRRGGRRRPGAARQPPHGPAHRAPGARRSPATSSGSSHELEPAGEREASYGVLVSVYRR